MTRKTLAKECADWIRRKAQAAFNALQQAEAGENLKASIARDEEIQKLKDRIEKLQANLRKELEALLWKR